ncbi:hypothetical protein MesoLj113b_68140 (plasmid) [Mesorhizobium sp. 113-3-3]|nr:hypothetical protein MesoLj113b_68140 [Mesorhizobium sp. 113-3-3]
MYIGLYALVLSNNRHQPVGSDACGRRYADEALGVGVHQRFNFFEDRTEGTGNDAGKSLPGPRQIHVALPAHEEIEAQLEFKLPYLPRHRDTADIQLFARFG